MARTSGSFDVRGCRRSGALSLELIAKTDDVGLENPIGWAGLINWLLELAKRTEEPVQRLPLRASREIVDATCAKRVTAHGQHVGHVRGCVAVVFVRANDAVQEFRRRVFGFGGGGVVGRRAQILVRGRWQDFGHWF